MPAPIELKPLSDDETGKELGKVKTLSTNFPKRSTGNAVALRSAMTKWAANQPAPSTPAVKSTPIQAVKLTEGQLAKLRAIHESETPTAEAIVGQKATPDEVIGIVYSAIGALEMSKLEGERKARLAKARTDAQRAKVDSEWADVVSAAQTAFAAAGLPGLKESDLQQFSKAVHSSKANLTAVVNIANTGVAVKGAVSGSLTARTRIGGAWVPTVGVFPSVGSIVLPIPNLCSTPFAQGTITQHFSKGFSLTVKITVWCPTWSKPWKTCDKYFTLANLSFSVSVNVGYKVTCCGATVWGQASAQVCAGILGITFCAGCSATIVGVAGVARSPSGGSCTYGIGVNAQLKCTFGGVTVFNVSAPFGFNVVGPCPPPGLC